ncbi:MAG: UDP-N-acetylmuramate dehydrogenase, partial [Blastocatellia bacterium]
RHLAGVECLAGIPGTVGGAPIQNIGAYGQEISETVTAVRLYDRQTRKIVSFTSHECGFAYRASVFNTTQREAFVVLSVTFALSMHGKPELKYPELKKHFAGRGGLPSLHDVREAVLAIRARKGMVLSPADPDSRSAGSFFKNPLVTTEKLAEIEKLARKARLITKDETPPYFPADAGRVKIPAAWLIERAGFDKGYGAGRVGLSSKHSLAIVNRGGASAQDVISLMREIQSRVHLTFSITLSPEPGFVSPEGW